MSSKHTLYSSNLNRKFSTCIFYSCISYVHGHQVYIHLPQHSPGLLSGHILIMMLLFSDTVPEAVKLAVKQLKARYASLHHTKINPWSDCPKSISLDYLFTSLVMVMKDNSMSKMYM